MEDKDFERIEKLFTRLSDDFSRKLEEQGEVFGRKLDQQSEDFQRWLGVQGDDFQHKLNLVVEGQQMLAERMDRAEVEIKEEIRKVDQRVTAVAADLSAHRKDTEAHGTVYRVKESGE